MTDLALSDHVVIRCPQCGASEDAEPATLVDAPIIVCRNCGETWPASPRRTKRRPSAALSLAAGGRESEIVEAERRPLVTFSAGSDQAWVAKMESDVLPVAPPNRSRLPMAAAALASALFICAFLGGREAAVAAIPDLAGLYATLGLPVNLDGLAIEGIRAERMPAATAGLSIRGNILNIGGEDRTVPPLTAAVYDDSGLRLVLRGFDPPGRSMAPGESAPFALDLRDVPAEATKVILRFGAAGEAPVLAGPRGQGS